MQKYRRDGALQQRPRPPLNPSFTLAQQIAVPKLTPEQTGQTQAVAELPLKQVEFQPDSTELTEKGRADILAQIVPVLKQTPGLYLKVEGSAFQPAGDTPQANEAFARARAQAVIFYLIGQGIDGNRLIEGYIKPQFPGSTEPESSRRRIAGSSLRWCSRGGDRESAVGSRQSWRWLAQMVL